MRSAATLVRVGVVSWGAIQISGTHQCRKSQKSLGLWIRQCELRWEETSLSLFFFSFLGIFLIHFEVSVRMEPCWNSESWKRGIEDASDANLYRNIYQIMPPIQTNLFAARLGTPKEIPHEFFLINDIVSFDA